MFSEKCWSIKKTSWSSSIHSRGTGIVCWWRFELWPVPCWLKVFEPDLRIRGHVTVVRVSEDNVEVAVVTKVALYVVALPHAWSGCVASDTLRHHYPCKSVTHSSRSLRHDHCHSLNRDKTQISEFMLRRGTGNCDNVKSFVCFYNLILGRILILSIDNMFVKMVNYYNQYYFVGYTFLFINQIMK